MNLLEIVHESWRDIISNHHNRPSIQTLIEEGFSKPLDRQVYKSFALPLEAVKVIELRHESELLHGIDQNIDHLVNQGVLVLYTSFTAKYGEFQAEYWKEMLRQVIMHLANKGGHIWVIPKNLMPKYSTLISNKTFTEDYTPKTIYGIPVHPDWNYMFSRSLRGYQASAEDLLKMNVLLKKFNINKINWDYEV